ncbi:rab-like protein 3 isoform X2 [Hydra vulgaris]|uniref:Rab-like protein 3 isoform X2 n=1 Tax=Hydra vulgaris TaxID=6087 RepID=A0ABM4BKQ6_HYDVU
MAAHMDRIKLLVLGDSGVGKSTFVNSLVSQSPCYNCSSTIGASIEVLPYTYSGQHGHSRDVFLEFWDVGGSSGNKHSRGIFYSNVNGLILVHDLSNRKSFTNLQFWLKEVLNAGRQEMTGVSISGAKERNSTHFEENIIRFPILVLGLKEGQTSQDQSYKTTSHIGLTDDTEVFFVDMNCFQESQLLTTSNKWNALSSYFEKVIENRFYPSGRNFTQENEYWRGRKKVF